MNIVEYNKLLRQNFEKTGDIKFLLRYVLTEGLDPICDYENMISIIRKYKDAYNNPTLLFIGSYWLSWWFHEKNNDCLNDLNNLKEYMTNEELAITYYLNAFHISCTDRHYATNPDYRNNLLFSMHHEVPFVNNRMRLAEISFGNEKRQLYVEALRNVADVDNSMMIDPISEEIYAEPSEFIGEFITGITPSSAHYCRLLTDALKAFNEI